MTNTKRPLLVFGVLATFVHAEAQVVDDLSKRGAPRLRAGSVGSRSSRKAPLNYDPLSILVTGTSSATLTVGSMKLSRSALSTSALSQRPSHVSRYQLEPGADPVAAVAAIRAQGGKAQLRYTYSTLKAPTDPQYGNQWGLKNSGQTIVAVPGGSVVSSAANPPPPSDEVPFYDIGAEQAWDTITDCSSIVVAVIDSGVRSTHEDLVGNLWNDGAGHHGYSFIHDNYNAEDEISHGTHVAATIAAAANNNHGGSGVCWKAKIMSVQVIDHNDVGYSDDVSAGIHWAVDHGAKVINMSLGGTGDDQELHDAVAYAEAHDVVVVVAAGNSAKNNDATNFIPANYVTDSGLSVLAIQQDGNPASFTNYGQTKVHIGAPGNNVYSAIGAESDENDPEMATGWTPVYVAGATNGGTPPPFDPNWGWGTLTSQGEPQDGLYANVKNFHDEGAPTYRPSSKDYIYRTADLRPTNGWLPQDTVSYFGFLGEMDVDKSDQVALRCSPNPVASPPQNELLPYEDGGASVGGLTGNTKGAVVKRDFVLPDSCRVQNATIGYALVTDATNQRKGAILQAATITHVHALRTSYDVYRGTSMASPHVAGVAALLRAYRPYATARRIVADILASARPMDSLKTKTVSGGVVNAAAALSMVAPPTNFTAELE